MLVSFAGILDRTAAANSNVAPYNPALAQGMRRQGREPRAFWAQYRFFLARRSQMTTGCRQRATVHPPHRSIW